MLRQQHLSALFESPHNCHEHNNIETDYRNQVNYPILCLITLVLLLTEMSTLLFRENLFLVDENVNVEHGGFMAQRRSLDQRVRDAELQAARLKQAQRQLLTRQKIIVGGTLLSAASRDPALADQVATILRQKVTGRDLQAIEPVLAQLARAIEPAGTGPVPVTESTSIADLTASEPVGDTESPPVPALAGLENVSRRSTSRTRPL